MGVAAAKSQPQYMRGCNVEPPGLKCLEITSGELMLTIKIVLVNISSLRIPKLLPPPYILQLMKNHIYRFARKNFISANMMLIKIKKLPIRSKELVLQNVVLSCKYSTFYSTIQGGDKKLGIGLI